MSLRDVKSFKSVKAISTRAYLICSLLLEIYIRSGMDFIPDMCSACSSLVSVGLPNNITYIGAYAFRNYTSPNVMLDDASVNLM